MSARAASFARHSLAPAARARLLVIVRTAGKNRAAAAGACAPALTYNSTSARSDVVSEVLEMAVLDVWMGARMGRKVCPPGPDSWKANSLQAPAHLQRSPLARVRAP